MMSDLRSTPTNELIEELKHYMRYIDELEYESDRAFYRHMIRVINEELISRNILA